jgi:hypothetical protein
MLRHTLRASSIALGLLALATRAHAAPHLTLTRTTWTAPGGCTQVIEHAEVAGLSGDAKNVIDRDMTQAMIDEAVPSLYRSKDDMQRACTGTGRGVSQGEVWESGIATTRWLSVRLHQYLHGGTSPLDAYYCMTFDVREALGPATTAQFYTPATRAAFNRAIATRYPDADATQRAIYRSLHVANTQMFVTRTGVQIDRVNDADPHAGDMVTLVNRALRGAYAPGGPLDPATR